MMTIFFKLIVSLKNIYENIAVISGIVLKINNTLPILVLANACIKKKFQTYKEYRLKYHKFLFFL